MKANILDPLLEGFVGSIRLAVSLIAGVATAIVNVSRSFVNRTPISTSGGNPSHTKSS